MVKGIYDNKGDNAKIGLLGGTFDPVHNGHLAVAAAVLSSLQLDSVLFMPASQPPHKLTDSLTSYELRSLMLDLALAGTPFKVCYIEKKIKGPSYTIDTLQTLQQDYLDAEFYFIIGQDSFLEIHTWKQFHLLPEIACLVVVNRNTEHDVSVSHVLSDYFSQYSADNSGCLWRMPGQKQGGICFVVMPPVAISSRQIREKCRNYKPVSSLVPISVAQYIKQNNLYSSVTGYGQ